MRFHRSISLALLWIALGSGVVGAQGVATTPAQVVKLSTPSAAVSAISEGGQPVDWWFIYKIPQLPGGKDGQGSATGLEYMYFDSLGGQLAQSPHRLLDGNGALDQTLNAAFARKDKAVGRILYNDELPEHVKSSEHRKDDSKLGHTKGLLVFDTASKTAIWLLHSWPKYADPGVTDEQPALNFGQTFLCLSLDLDTARKIAAQMAIHQQPQVYDPVMPAGLEASDPLKALTKPLNANATGDSDVLDATTRGGLAFKVIAKNRNWGKDFWNDLVGPTIGENIDVETWIRGKIAPILDSDGIHKTFDIKFVDMRPFGAPWAWPEHNDHAKWGVSEQGNWVMVGDMNRMLSQESRGGGTIAFQDATLWNFLSKCETIVPPPGHTKSEAKAHIQATHQAAHATRRPAKPRTASSVRRGGAPTNQPLADVSLMFITNGFGTSVGQDMMPVMLKSMSP